jgi:hypothetical protein
MILSGFVPVGDAGGRRVGFEAAKKRPRLSSLEGRTV